MSGGQDRACDNCFRWSTCINSKVNGICEIHQFREEVGIEPPAKFKGFEPKVNKIKDYEFKPGMINYPDSKPKEFSLDKLIEDHWGYVQAMLEQHMVGKAHIDVAKFHYKSAFRHGYKHALERHDIKE